MNIDKSKTCELKHAKKCSNIVNNNEFVAKKSFDFILRLESSWKQMKIHKKIWVVIKAVMVKKHTTILSLLILI